MKYFGSAANGFSDFRLIPRVETFPKVVSFAQTSVGRFVILAVFGLGMRFFISNSVFVLVLAFIFGLMTFMPEYRRLILAVCPILFVVMQTIHDPLLLGSTLTVVISGIVLYWCAMRWPQSRFGKRPIAFLLTGFTGLILLAGATAQSSLPYSILWSLVGVTASYVWFIGYALTDRNSKPARDLPLEVATFRPLWGSTSTPFPKGAAYLRRIEAQNPEQLAIAQLKGLKLLVWAIMLAVFQNLWYRFFYGYLQIPTSAQALAMSVRGTPVAWHLRWESQVLFFFEVTLNFAVMGHRYFKELLVDFFYFPVFLRYWKGHKRLRTVFATFAAIAFGNSFFHLTRDWHFIQEAGPWKALVNYQVLFFYNVVLATAVSISQLRKRRPKPSGLLRRRFLPAFGVILFYCVLSVFGDESRSYTLAVHFKYLASLFLIHF
jgi:hypothetical protein